MTLTPKSSQPPWWLAPWFVPAVCGSIVAVCVVGWLVANSGLPYLLQSEPKYEGKPLSHWIAQTKDASPTVRGGAVMPLSYMAAESTGARQTLIALLQDKDGDVRVAAVRALGSMGPEAKKSVIPAFAKLLRDEDASVCRAAANVLGSMGPAAKEAVPALTELLRDSHLNTTAANTLGSIGPEAKSAVPALTNLLQKDSYSVRLDVVHALGKIGPAAKEAVPALTEQLRDQYADMRIVAAYALGEIGPGARSAVPALTERLRDTTYYVQKSAAEALKKIEPEAKSAGRRQDK